MDLEAAPSGAAFCVGAVDAVPAGGCFGKYVAFHGYPLWFVSAYEARTGWRVRV